MAKSATLAAIPGVKEEDPRTIFELGMWSMQQLNLNVFFSHCLT